LKFRRP